MERCCLVSPRLDGYMWVKWDESREREKLYFKRYQQCTKDATLSETRDGFVFNVCPEHSQAPSEVVK